MRRTLKTSLNALSLAFATALTLPAMADVTIDAQFNWRISGLVKASASENTVVAPHGITIASDGLTLSGNATDGDMVYARHTLGGEAIGVAQAGGGVFVITAPQPLSPGESIELFATNGSGQQSRTVTYVVPESTSVPPAAGGVLQPTPENVGVKGVFEGHEDAGELIYTGLYEPPSAGDTRKWHLFIQDPQEHARSGFWGERLFLTATSVTTTSTSGMSRSGYETPLRNEDGHYVSWRLATNPNGRVWNTPARHCTETLSGLVKTDNAWFQPALREMRHLGTTVLSQMVIGDNTFTRYWVAEDYMLDRVDTVVYNRGTGAFLQGRNDKDTVLYSICARRTIVN